MLIKIKCLQCNTDGSFSIADPSYVGPYKCWKCGALHTISIAGNEVISCEPLSQEDFDKQQEIDKLRDKFK
ncbi:hypothetical protein ACFLRP_04205 [Bacteroidota bacterium]